MNPPHGASGVLGCLLKSIIRDVHHKDSKVLKSADVKYINILLVHCVCFESDCTLVLVVTHK